MNGLESRLQAVDGVEAIELELGVDGLEGITVRLTEGADETVVLDGVRRLLVAYGTKVPRSGGPTAPATRPEADPAHEHERQGGEAGGNGEGAGTAPEQDFELSAPEQVAAASAPDGEEIRLAVSAGVDETTAVVTLSKGERVARRQIPASARAIVQAVIDAGAEVTGREPISVIGLNVSSVDQVRILTVIIGNHGTPPKVCTASVAGSNWPAALMDVLLQVLG